MMRAVWRNVSSWKRNQKGATAVEYGLIMSLMTLALLGALSTTGSSTQDKWDGVSNSISDSMETAGVS